MVDLAALSAATPGTVSEIAARLGVGEHEVRNAIEGVRARARARRQEIEVIGRRGGRSIYKIGPPPRPKPPPPPKVKKQRKRFNVRGAAVAPIPQPRVLREAPQATIKEAREVMAERVTRDCLRCKTRIRTTRHGPRYCDSCRRHINAIA